MYMEGMSENNSTLRNSGYSTVKSEPMIYGALSQENLEGKKNALIEDLRRDLINSGEDTERYGQKGKIFHLKFPSKGEFPGFELDYFVSDRSYNKRMDGTIEENPIIFKDRPDIQNDSFTDEEISEILKALNDYLRANGIILDKNINFVEDLQDDKFKYRCDTSDCLKKITGFDDKYFLKSGNRVGDYYLYCKEKQFCFYREGHYDYNDAKILTKVKR